MKQYNNKSLNMSYRDFSQVLKANGYSLSRQKGDHAIWVKAGKCSISIMVSFVSYDFKEGFSGRDTLPLRLEEYVVTQDKYEQIMNNCVFHNNEVYIYLDLQDGNCFLYNSDLITIVSTKGVDDVH